MKTKLIAITIVTLLAATPLTYARGGPGFGGGHFGGFGGGRSFSGGNRGFYGGGNRFYGGGNRFYGGGNRLYAGGRQYYGTGRGYYGHHGTWSGHYGRHGNSAGYHHRYHRGRYYYYGYSNDWWPWDYGYYYGDFYPNDSYVDCDDPDDGYSRRSHRKDQRRGDHAATDYETPKVYQRR
jgi:hypothetical protein